MTLSIRLLFILFIGAAYVLSACSSGSEDTKTEQCDGPQSPECVNSNFLNQQSCEDSGHAWIEEYLSKAACEAAGYIWVSADGSDASGSDSPVNDGQGRADASVGNACEDLAEGAACDDKNPCTSGDVCENAICKGGASTVCDEHGQCQVGSCDKELGCIYELAADDSVCSVPCFDEGVCKDGDCEAVIQSKTVCPNPVEPCVALLQCDSGTGACSVPVYDAEGTACDSDNDLCSSESCGAEGQCESNGLLETCSAEQAADPCRTYSCDPALGCIVKAFIENGPCSDGDSCTVSDLCISTGEGQGGCAGIPMDSDDGNPCTADSCKDGAVTHISIDGLSCDPNDECSPTGICKDSVCVALSSCP